MSAPALDAIPGCRFDLGGEIGRRLATIIEQWILPAPAANPALLEMLADRDREPPRQLVPWAGEFAGKYLTHACQILRLTGDGRLRLHLERFVAELLRQQADDGYLGCWPAGCRLANRAPNATGGITWDTWGHYHAMLGLLLWHELAGDAAALAGARRIGDLLCDRFLAPAPRRLVDTGWSEANLAPIHSLCLLYRRSGDDRHLRLARQIADEFAAVGSDGRALAGDYLRAGLAGTPFHRTPRPRWESLHPIQGLAELHLLTGDRACREAFESLWWSMLEGDRHSTGGFTSGEQATGDPYHQGAIETCCTVAWMAMTVDQLRLTGDPLAADELELSLFNSGLGALSPSGRWATYDTPMDGRREASAQAIVFQARAGSPELNCCSVNGPRALGLLGEWALMRRGDGLALNYFGPGSITAPLPAVGSVTVTQDTDYPRRPEVALRVEPARGGRFPLALRIPAWSAATRVAVNGAPIDGVRAGTYLVLDRDWRSGDRVDLAFDFRLQAWRHPRPPHRELGPWQADWRLVGPVESLTGACDGHRPEDLAPDRATILPAGGPLVRSRGGAIDFRQHLAAARPHAAAWCCTEIESPAAGMLPVAIACDWWYACFVNGAPVASGANLRGTRLDLPLRQGRNLVAFRIIAGTAGWSIALDCGRLLPGGAPNPGAAGAAEAMVAALYRGPILLAHDPRLDPGGPPEAPHWASAEADLLPCDESARLAPWILVSGRDQQGRARRLCDFASAGAGGTAYRSWLPLAIPCPETAFDRARPRRTAVLGAAG